MNPTRTINSLPCQNSFASREWSSPSLFVTLLLNSVTPQLIRVELKRDYSRSISCITGSQHITTKVLKACFHSNLPVCEGY